MGELELLSLKYDYSFDYVLFEILAVCSKL